MKNEPNQTMLKFGYPGTLVAKYEFWVVLMRSKQVTLGSLVLACREHATAFADLSRGAFEELRDVVAGVEANLRREVAFEKINYLMLMMVDPNVHFHVIPRYSGSRTEDGVDYPDPAWPGPPDLKATVELAPGQFDSLVSRFRSGWRRI